MAVVAHASMIAKPTSFQFSILTYSVSLSFPGANPKIPHRQI
jgi:hypothetical protein